MYFLTSTLHFDIYSLTPSRCPTTQFNPDVSFTEAAQTPKVKGPQDCSISNTTCKSWVSQCICTFTLLDTKTGLLIIPSGSVIHWNDSQNSWKHHTYIYFFIIKVTNKQPQAVHRARLEGFQTQELLSPWS